MEDYKRNSLEDFEKILRDKLRRVKKDGKRSKKKG